MKKTYIAPKITIVKVNNVILAGSDTTIGVNGNATEGMGGWGGSQSRYNNVNFIDEDEDDYATGW